MSSQSLDKIFYKIGAAPLSADPIDYDSIIHHAVFRSVLGCLVTQYRLGGFSGEIAKSWDVSADGLVWTFHIQEELTFDNGEILRPSHVKLAWQRLHRLISARKSTSELFERIDDVQNDIVADDEKNELIIKLNKPFEKLLETVSFGLYAVPHPSNYNLQTSEWMKGSAVVASNAYSIDVWNEQHCLLRLRNDWPKNLMHARPFKFVDFVWEDRLGQNLDLINGFSLSQIDKDYVFHGPIKSGIFFVHVLNWNDPQSPFYKREFRQHFRNQFYKALQNSDLEFNKSFFPLAIAGVQEMPDPVLSMAQSASLPKTALIRYRLSSSLSTVRHFKKFDGLVAGIASEMGLQSESVVVPNDKIQNLYDWQSVQPIDLMIRGTTMLIEAPYADIKFMFLTQEGIKLPDADGSIVNAIRGRDVFSIQDINQKIWDQAIIWPIVDFSMGVWAKNHVDVSQVNFSIPPIELQWIGEK